MRILQTVAYSRTRAVRYALRHWNNPSPDYANMDTVGAGGDCTNFVSQALVAGGWPMDYRRTGFDTEWWYRRIGQDRFDQNNDDWWSCTWALADLHFRYMMANGAQVLDVTSSLRRARRLRRGDICYYDFDGDGRITHSALVTSHSRSGIPRVTYRTLRPRSPVRNRDYRLRFRGRARRIWGVRIPSRPMEYPIVPDWNQLRPCDRTRA